MTEEIQSQPKPTEAGQQAAAEAIEAIKGRSYSGRHPELGKMISCKICGLRHRENERKCVQKFSTSNRQGDPVQGELVPPEGLTNLTIKQVLGAARFKGRMKPRRRPQKPMTKWIRILVNAQKKKVQ